MKTYGRKFYAYPWLRIYGLSKESDQELDKGHMLILLATTVQNRSGNISGAPRRSSVPRNFTDDFCSYSFSEIYGISDEIDQVLHLGVLL